MNSEAERIIQFIRNTIATYSFRGIVIGISGGIDSAVSAGLCVKALGPEKVLGVVLTERDSSPETKRDAKAVCRHLGIKCTCKNISGVLRKMGTYALVPPTLFAPRKVQENYVRNRWHSHSDDTFVDDLKTAGDAEFLKGAAYYRSKHRARMAMLYLQAEKRGYTIVGATNKTELKTGFYVKYGDDSVDIEPLAHLYKTQVRDLGKELALPQQILQKNPSPDLIPGLTDEYALQISYIDLDRILLKKQRGKSLEDEKKENVERVEKIANVAYYRTLKNLSLQ